MTDEAKLLERITVNPNIFGGKPIIRGRRLAVEHVLGMLAAGDTPETILEGYPWLGWSIFRPAWFMPSGWSRTNALNRCGWTRVREAAAGYLRLGRDPRADGNPGP